MRIVSVKIILYMLCRCALNFFFLLIGNGCSVAGNGRTDLKMDALESSWLVGYSRYLVHARRRSRWKDLEVTHLRMVEDGRLT